LLRVATSLRRVIKWFHRTCRGIALKQGLKAPRQAPGVLKGLPGQADLFPDLVHALEVNGGGSSTSSSSSSTTTAMTSSSTTVLCFSSIRVRDLSSPGTFLVAPLQWHKILFGLVGLLLYGLPEPVLTEN